METFPLSLLNDFLYCRRRAALKEIEGMRSGNVHTVQGDLLHEHADLAGYEIHDGVKLLRALPVYSERHGLSGKCDIVEVWPRPNGESSGTLEYRPVEYKKGKKRVFDNDDAQLCAQALCLEEMLGTTIERGAVYHAASRIRRDVTFTPELRRSTEEAIAMLRQMVEEGRVPPAIFKPQCEACSLFEVCLPAATSLADRAARVAASLFITP